MYTVYEVYREGEEMPESWWRPRRVVGELEFGEGRLARYSFKTANLVGPDAARLLGEITHARVLPRKNGRLIVAGFQKPADIKDLDWRKRSYQQEWLCVPVPDAKNPPSP